MLVTSNLHGESDCKGNLKETPPRKVIMKIKGKRDHLCHLPLGFLIKFTTKASQDK